MHRTCALCLLIASLTPTRTLAQQAAPRSPRAAPLAAERASTAGISRAPDPADPSGAGLPTLPIRGISSEEVVVAGALSASLLAASFIPWPGSSEPAWRGGVLFDDVARQSLMLTEPDARPAASLASDLLLGLTALPVVFDAAILAWALRDDPELAARMLLIDLQAFALAQGVTSLVKHVTARERPNARGCRENPQRRETDASCHGSADPGIAPESFFSGHTSIAFTSAALVCLHHTELGLLGQGGDAAMCATSLGLATAVGALRIVSDRHYASDVLIGAGVGLLSGWLVPWLLHYDVPDTATPEDVDATVAPMVDRDRIGLQVFGSF